MSEPKEIETRILYKDPFAYAAHPFIAGLQNGDWLVVFNQSIRRRFILHPPEDPYYHNLLIRSKDEGRSWSKPRAVPGYNWHGVECAGLTSLQDGSVLLNQWQFHWYPLEAARCLPNQDGIVYPHDWVDELQVSGELDTGAILAADPDESIPWARGSGRTLTHLSRDFGGTWGQTVEIDTRPYSGGYGMRGGVQLPGGDILLPLSDVPHYETVFVLRSRDGGRSWGNVCEVAHLEGHFFEEPSGVVLHAGEVLILMRDNTTHRLYQVSSADGGWTWSSPVPTQIQGYPGHVVLLLDGRLLCVYGVRRPPYGIQAVLSTDQGKTWEIDHPLILRDDLPNRDLGYPSAVQAADGRIFVVYYGQDKDGVTCIQSTRFVLG